MSQDPFAQQPQYAHEAPRQRGCFFYGCITAIILFVLGVCGITALFYYGYSQFTNVLKEYADDTPIELPEIKLAPEARESVDKRAKAFRADLEADKLPETLVLDSDEINMLLQEHNQEMAKRVRVELVGDKVQGQVSLPLDVFDIMGLFALKGKFFNAKGTFKVSLEDGVLIVVLDEAEAKGKPLPASIMDALRKDNLAKDVYKDPDNAKWLRKIESIEVKDSKLIIKPRDPKKAAAEAEEKSKKADSAKPKDEAKPGPKDEAKKPDTEPAKSKDEAKPASKDEPKKPDSEPAKPKDEAKPAPKDEAKPAPKDEAKPKT